MAVVVLELHNLKREKYIFIHLHHKRLSICFGPHKFDLFKVLSQFSQVYTLCSVFSKLKNKGVIDHIDNVTAV